jgi:hypothetical protein
VSYSEIENTVSHSEIENTVSHIISNWGSLFF